jgi:hypothetical protein
LGKNFNQATAYSLSLVGAEGMRSECYRQEKSIQIRKSQVNSYAVTLDDTQEGHFLWYYFVICTVQNQPHLLL